MLMAFYKDGTNINFCDGFRPKRARRVRSGTQATEENGL